MGQVVVKSEYPDFQGTTISSGGPLTLKMLREAFEKIKNQGGRHPCEYGHLMSPEYPLTGSFCWGCGMTYDYLRKRLDKEK